MISDKQSQSKYFTPTTVESIREWSEYDLVLTEVKVLSLIRILSHKTGSTFVLNRYLSENSGVTIRAVENAVKSLAEKGLITRKEDRRRTVIGKFEVDRQLAPIYKQDRIFVPEAGVDSPDHLPHSSTDPLKVGSLPPEDQFATPRSLVRYPPNQNVDIKKEILKTENVNTGKKREDMTIQVSIPPISPTTPSVVESEPFSDLASQEQEGEPLLPPISSTTPSSVEGDAFGCSDSQEQEKQTVNDFTEASTDPLGEPMPYTARYQKMQSQKRKEEALAARGEASSKPVITSSDRLKRYLALGVDPALLHAQSLPAKNN